MWAYYSLLYYKYSIQCAICIHHKRIAFRFDMHLTSMRQYHLSAEDKQSTLSMCYEHTYPVSITHYYKYFAMKQKQKCQVLFRFRKTMWKKNPETLSICSAISQIQQNNLIQLTFVCEINWSNITPYTYTKSSNSAYKFLLFYLFLFYFALLSQ